MPFISLSIWVIITFRDSRFVASHKRPQKINLEQIRHPECQWNPVPHPLKEHLRCMDCELLAFTRMTQLSTRLLLIVGPPNIGCVAAFWSCCWYSTGISDRMYFFVGVPKEEPIPSRGWYICWPCI